MNINRLKQFAGTAVVAASIMGASQSAVAQKSNVPDKTESPVMQRFEREIGTATYDYWIARLNDYKRTIDRTLSPADLATLNSLRVRFGVMISEATVSSSVDANTAEKKGTASFSLGMDDEKALEKVQEFFTIFQETKDLASRYRSDFRPLGEGVIEDFFGFVDVMSTRAEKFAADNQAELAREKDGAALLSMKNEAHSFVSDLKSDEGRMMLQMGYSQFIEPMIMLFDGAELSLFLQQAAPFAKGVTGLNLPDASLLQQSTPNPASSSVSIGYQLNEPSDRTTLRLFNSSGTLVGTFDQGSRPAGQNSAMIDVSSYPTGRYLYHLTIQTSKGEQVYSKSMQVVR